MEETHEQKRLSLSGRYKRFFLCERTALTAAVMSVLILPVIYFFGTRSGGIELPGVYDLMLQFLLIVTLYYSLRKHKLFLMQVAMVGLLFCMLCAQSQYALGNLANRIIGEVTPEKAEIVRESDAVLREEIAVAGLDRHVNQYFTVLTGIQSVGVMGDERTYDYTVALRAVTTDDFMTADWARLPYDLLARISSRIVNEVPRVSRVVYDITSKPPASIEWE